MAAKFRRRSLIKFAGGSTGSANVAGQTREGRAVLTREQIPAEFRANRAQFGPAHAPAWLDALPVRVAELAVRWHLRPDGAPRFGAANLVLPVVRDAEPCMLRLSPPEHDVQPEIDALVTWEGHGAALLMEHDLAASAMLLERLDADRTLKSIPLDDAAEQAGRLIRQLAITPPHSATPLLAILSDHAQTLPGRNTALGNPIHHRWIDQATALAAELAADLGDRDPVLVHADLHYGNILAGTRSPWLAIDPRPVAGDPEFSVPELMWTRADEAPDSPTLRSLLHAVVSAGELDLGRARAYALTRTVNYWLWALEHGLTIDPPRCERVVAALSR